MVITSCLTVSCYNSYHSQSNKTLWSLNETTHVVLHTMFHNFLFNKIFQVNNSQTCIKLSTINNTINQSNSTISKLISYRTGYQLYKINYCTSIVVLVNVQINYQTNVCRSMVFQLIKNPVFHFIIKFMGETFHSHFKIQ
jgi:hypothetical protein